MVKVHASVTVPPSPVNWTSLMLTAAALYGSLTRPPLVMPLWSHASTVLAAGALTVGGVVSSMVMVWVTVVAFRHGSVTTKVRVITIGQVPTGALSW